jgi:hypothetical protein
MVCATTVLSGREGKKRPKVPEAVSMSRPLTEEMVKTLLVSVDLAKC